MFTFAEPHSAHVVLSLTTPAFGPIAASTKLASNAANTTVRPSVTSLCEAISPRSVHDLASAAGWGVEMLLVTMRTRSSHCGQYPRSRAVDGLGPRRLPRSEADPDL